MFNYNIHLKKKGNSGNINIIFISKKLELSYVEVELFTSETIIFL